ncbi:MAG: hypothetical protein ACUZ77_00160 [Candidatus Brocadiales bacterium]
MKKTILFVLVPTVVMILCVQCKSLALSASPVQVVKEFVKASKEADFKKIAGLSCQSTGPYLTLEDAQKLDLSKFGLLEEVIREETYELDLEGLKIVVARFNFFVQIKFCSFLVFKTDTGWKVFTNKEDIVWEYPLRELTILKIATSFYLSNEIKLDVALRLAKKTVDLEPDDAKNHHWLGYIYDLKESLEDNKELKEGLAEKKYSEYTQALKINTRYEEKFSKETLIIIWERLLEDPDEKLRDYATKKLMEIKQK